MNRIDLGAMFSVLGKGLGVLLVILLVFALATREGRSDPLPCIPTILQLKVY